MEVDKDVELEFFEVLRRRFEDVENEEFRERTLARMSDDRRAKYEAYELVEGALQ